MARILVVFHRHPRGQWRSTYQSHLDSFKLVEGHDVFYLNTAWYTFPNYLESLDPDFVIFHYTFLALRQVPTELEKGIRPIQFLKSLPCPKAIVPHDEQAHADLLVAVCRDFGVTHIFTPAAETEWAQIYRGLDLDRITFKTVLTGYIDDDAVRKFSKRAERQDERPIDVGYRSWDTWPFYGRHGRLKGAVGSEVKEHASEYGLVTDISSDYRDAFLGDSWFDFLLKCKYTLGVEGGSSVFDWDGSVAGRTRRYMKEHEGAPFEEVEAACFPGLDGQFHYYLLGPRHFEAVITRTCQVLVEGTYGGALQAGKHYISLKRDFSNLDEVLGVMRADTLRAEMVDRAYEDLIASGLWTYDAFARGVLDTGLAGATPSHRESPGRVRFLLVRNRLASNRTWEKLQAFSPKALPLTLREYARDTLVLAVGEERLWRLLVRVHNLIRRVRGQELLSVEYVPTAAEIARRKDKAEGRSRG